MTGTDLIIMYPIHRGDRRRSVVRISVWSVYVSCVCFLGAWFMSSSGPAAPAALAAESAAGTHAGGPSHLQQPADVECWISQDGGARWTRRGVLAPRDDADAARGMFAAGAAPNGDLVVLSTGHAKTLASKPGWGPVTPTWISRSSDGGQTWTIDKSGFPKGPDGKVLNPFGDVVVGHDGALRATAHGDTNAVGTLVSRSRDNGRTWIDPVRIAQDKGTNEADIRKMLATRTES